MWAYFSSTLFFALWASGEIFSNLVFTFPFFPFHIFFLPFSRFPPKLWLLFFSLPRRRLWNWNSRNTHFLSFSKKNYRWKRKQFCKKKSSNNNNNNTTVTDDNKNKTKQNKNNQTGGNASEIKNLYRIVASFFLCVVW